MSHTPGPWKWADDYLYQAVAYDAYQEWLTSPETDTKWSEDWQSPPEPIVETDSGVYGPRGADRPLIAAAPDLLAALKACSFALAKLVAYSGAFTDEHASALDASSQAIAAAEGSALPASKENDRG